VDEPFPGDIGAQADAILTLENAPLPLVVASPDGTIRMANRALRELLGYGPVELVGQEIWSLSADLGASRERWRRLIETGGATEHPAELVRRDGSGVKVSAAAVVVPDEDGAARLIISRAIAR
jgi:PAS domain S-box-containing protein